MKPIVTLTALALIGCAAASSAAPAPSASLAVTETRSFDQFTINDVAASKPDLIVHYGSGAKQFGELRLPKGRGPFPVAMLVHGGCWTAGMGSPRNMAALATWLTAHGVATWNVDYRELGSGGGWTGTFDDWAGALAQLSALAKPHHLDLGRVSVVGHSAGATAAGWLAGPGKDGPAAAVKLPKLRSAVILDGPSSLAAFVGADSLICGEPVIAKMMGGSPEAQPARYAMVDPALHPLQVRQFTMVAGVLPYDKDFIPGLKAKGVAAEQVTLVTESHFDLLAPGTRDFVAAAPVLLRATGGR